ncbi:hypothetical protein C4D60_Mb00t08470 [Musa balbisiana]|uniref:Ribulose bisphosphate carboxylase large chain n=1 Tax=Musa balbisiana TaxID=52838 RepID=A0A4S8I2P7_MUSBA|nr:hypothetical protein C4D60_Mb00t08470 [Musa balbisiana]
MSCREGLMSPQTETKASVGFKAGVKDYKLTYYTPDYEVKDTDILAAFRVTPQPGVPPEEAGAAVAAESSTGTWTTVWTDGLTSLDRYKGRCYHIEAVVGEENQYIAYVAYPLDLFEEGSVTNMFTSIVGNVFGFKALRALRLEDLRIPTSYSKTFQGPPHGIQVERDKLNKYGRPLLGCTIKPKLGLSAKNYGRAVYECLRGGLDFTKDDENVNSQPFMRWRDRFLFCAEAIFKAQAETGEIKGHYLNATAETKASVGFKAGVKDYKLTYYTPDYEVKDTDILAAFRVTPQPGVPPEEAGAAVAAESSTGTWTTVWTDGLTSLDRYKGRCYHIEAVVGEENQYIAYVAYPLDLFEEGSVTNMFTSIVGNVFGFKALRALRLEDLRIPTSYSKTFQGPPHGIQVERDKLNKYGRPLLGCTIKPKLGLSAKNYGRAVYECLRGGLDFTKDDENVNSQPFMRWRDRFLFCAEAIFKAQAETGEIKGHYLNATAGTCEEMMKRAICARELGVPIVMHDYLTGGFTANTSLAHYCRDNGLLLHIHRAMHAVIDRQKNHGMHFRVLAKALRMSGGDHIHAGTVVGKLEGEREMTLGFVDLLRDDYIEKDRSRGIFFTQDWVSMPGVLPVASGGIHVWHMPALTEIFGDDSVLQFGGGTLGHPWGNAPGAVANRVALEACVQARNEGRDLAREGNEIIREASKWSPELAAACEVWKEIKFEFEPVDKLDKEKKGYKKKNQIP